MAPMLLPGILRRPAGPLSRPSQRGGCDSGGPDQVKPTFRKKCPSLRLRTPPPAQCTMYASRMMARIITTTQKKNTMMPGTVYPATVLVLATAASYPAPPALFGGSLPGTAAALYVSASQISRLAPFSVTLSLTGPGAGGCVTTGGEEGTGTGSRPVRNVTRSWMAGTLTISRL